MNTGGGLVTTEGFVHHGAGRLYGLIPLSPAVSPTNSNGSGSTTYTQVTPDPIINHNLPTSFTFPLVNIYG